MPIPLFLFQRGLQLHTAGLLACVWHRFPDVDLHPLLVPLVKLETGVYFLYPMYTKNDQRSKIETPLVQHYIVKAVIQSDGIANRET